MNPIITAIERIVIRHPHTKRMMPAIIFPASHRPINHPKKFPPYKLQQRTEGKIRNTQTIKFCRGRLGLFLFPFCISLAVFIITTFFFALTSWSDLFHVHQKVGLRGKKVSGKNTSRHLWRREDFCRNRYGLTFFPREKPGIPLHLNKSVRFVSLL